MTLKRLAVIDLGSNTFHLLIVDLNPDTGWTAVHKDRRYVKLASGGMNRIEDASIERGMKVMKEFADQITEFGVDKTIATGTAALREAVNGTEVVNMLTEVSGIHILLIDGETEAKYIYRGIYSCLPPLDTPALIMDIGGGSVEFILYQGRKILFIGSYTIGVAVMYKHYHTSDPIPVENIVALESALDIHLAELGAVLASTDEYYLVGASGSFEVIRDVMPKIESGEQWSQLDIEGLVEYLDEVIGLDYMKRKVRAEIPKERLDYIVVAYILIRYVLQRYPPKGLYYSDFALKEGIIAEAADIFRDV